MGPDADGKPWREGLGRGAAAGESGSARSPPPGGRRDGAERRRRPPRSGRPQGPGDRVAREGDSVQRRDDAVVRLAQSFKSESRDRKLIYLQPCVNQLL